MTTRPPVPSPHWTTDNQSWRVVQERQRHDQVLYGYGEFSLFFLMWQESDHVAGLVGRCPVCYLSQGKIADAYGQPSQNRCPSCFGTTYEGGVKNALIRPALWDATDPTTAPTRRGIVVTDDLNVETTWDVEVCTGDYVARRDGTRWQLRTPSTTSQADGFNSGYPTTGALMPRAQREDPSSVAFLIPPPANDLIPMLAAGRPGYVDVATLTVRWS